MFRRSGEYHSEQRENMRGGAGIVTLQHFFRKEEFGGSHFRVCARLILPPGAGIGLHPHENEDEVYVVCKGTGTVTDDGVTSEVHPGDSVLTGRGKAHSLSNTGNETLEVLAFVVTY